MCRQLKFNAGFNLLEVMIALALSALVMTSVVTVFWVNKKSLDSQSTMEDIMVKAEQASWMLLREGELSGYFGCLTQTVANMVNHTAVSVTPETVFEVIDHTIHLQYLKPFGTVVSVVDGNTKVEYSGEASVKAGDVIGVISCKNGELVTVANVNAKNSYIVLNEPLIGDYSNYTVVGKLVDRFYFVKDSSLFMKEGSEASQALLDGVESFHIQDEDSIEKWSAIKTIKIDWVLSGSFQSSFSIVKKWPSTIFLKQRM